MHLLIIEEDLSTKCLQNFVFGDSAEKKCCIDSHSPCSKCLDNSRMSRAITSGYYGNAHRRVYGVKLLLHFAKYLQQLSERTFWQWFVGVISLVFEERL